MPRAPAVLLAVLVAAPALAAPPLVPTQAGHKGVSVTVATGGAAIAPADFVAAILDGSHYPKTASYMGVPALLDCVTLGKDGDYTIVYQRTGGNALIKSRHYVIALRPTQVTDSGAVVEWNLVQHAFDGTRYVGPYQDALNKHPEAVYTPYNHGSWRYDQRAGTITYSAESDPGGSVPSWMVGEGAAMAFPRELMKTRWGVGG